MRAIKNKKAQMEYPIITFIAVIVMLIIFSPFMLKIFNSFLTPFGNAVGNQTAVAGERVAHIKNVGVNFWDFVILMAFLVNIILLFITAFLIDTHPVFLILFILFGFFTFIFAPEIMGVLDKIYNDPNLALEVSKLPITDFLRENLMLVVLGIYFICGIIIYSKFRWGGQPR